MVKTHWSKSLIPTVEMYGNHSKWEHICWNTNLLESSKMLMKVINFSLFVIIMRCKTHFYLSLTFQKLCRADKICKIIREKMLFIFKLESLRKEEDNRVNFFAKIFCKQNFSLQYEETFLFCTFQFYIIVINRCLLPFIVV